jgi:preprotein translocase subunit SecY
MGNGEWGMGHRCSGFLNLMGNGNGEWGMGNGVWLIIFLVLSFKNSSNQINFSPVTVPNYT